MADAKKWIGGRLWKNTRKKTATQPDFTGDLEITPELLAFINSLKAEGKPLKVSVAGWLKFSTKSSQTYVSLQASQPRARVQETLGSLADAFMKAGMSEKGQKGEPDDDIPF